MKTSTFSIIIILNFAQWQISWLKNSYLSELFNENDDIDNIDGPTKYVMLLLIVNSHSAYRGISRDDIHCPPALTAARAAMHRLVRQC